MRSIRHVAVAMSGLTVMAQAAAFDGTADLMLADAAVAGAVVAMSSSANNGTAPVAGATANGTASSANGTPAGGSGAGELAEFIVNLARYATWPADPARKELTICFAHGGGLSMPTLALDDATQVKGRPVVMRAINTPQQVASCNVVWFNSDVRPAPRLWLDSIGERPILTVSNYADFTADGGIVGAYRLNGDWRFEINLEALQRSRISIAAAALRLSQKPKSSRSGGESK